VLIAQTIFILERGEITDDLTNATENITDATATADGVSD